MINQVKKQVTSTRTRLLDAARYLFWEKGYAATGMAEILDRAEANSGSFYHFFDSKEALLLAVLDDYLQGLEPVIVRPAFERHSDPIDRIFAILEGYRARLIDTGCRYGCPLGRLALEIEAENIPAHSRISANFKGWIGAIRGCLEAASDRVPPGLDLEALATFVLTTMEGGVLQSRSARRLEPFDQSVAQLRNYIDCLTGNSSRPEGKPT
ncbi:MAG TPA: TetR/AcrR family transcriptional regulator [Bryobacteraceae bacterium]|nr:TetR/AcrR family transcriptional regulator [Bryobacteraceae bacterium]